MGLSMEYYAAMRCMLMDFESCLLYTNKAIIKQYITKLQT